MSKLHQYLEDHITNKKTRVFSGFGIGAHEDPGKAAAAAAAGGSGSDDGITTVTLGFDGTPNQDEAKRLLRRLDEDLSTRLAAKYRPEKLAYDMQCDSGPDYWARSVAAKGQLSAIEVMRQVDGWKRPLEGDDVVPTRPATPEPPRAVVVIELEDQQSGGSPAEGSHL
ncbi:hypothetical protein F4780DRAFT_725331 [Xylariomycetidae sp. FL0641]|nr:hypothetical protein F4780DRAFT_725331 [Xylariomycetidae sp. FL0641]